MQKPNYYIDAEKKPFRTVSQRVRCYIVPRPPQNEIERAIKEAKEKYKRNEIKRNYEQ